MNFDGYCPIPKEYSKDYQHKAADELESLPDGSIIAVMISDYGVLRAQSRACLEDYD